MDMARVAFLILGAIAIAGSSALNVRAAGAERIGLVRSGLGWIVKGRDRFFAVVMSSLGGATVLTACDPHRGHHWWGWLIVFAIMVGAFSLPVLVHNLQVAN